MKNRILFFLLESIFGFVFGLIGIYVIGDLNLDSGFTWGIPLLIIFFIPLSIIGIAIPGYFQCKLYNELEFFRSAMLSSFVWLIASLILLMFISMVISIPNWLLIGIAIIFSVSGFNLQIQEQPAANTR